jgi:2-oxoglutarate dehydrogenase complex dehydrogenase (E1) component-like enzyme
MGLLAQLSRRGAAAGLAWRAAAARGIHSSIALCEPPPAPVPLSKMKDSFLDGTSSTYLEELEERYRSNPASVDKSWASFFKSMGEFAAQGRPRAPRAPPAAVRRPAPCRRPRHPCARPLLRSSGRRRSYSAPLCTPATPAHLEPPAASPPCNLNQPPPRRLPVPLPADMGVPAEAAAEAYDAFERGLVSSPLAAAAVSNQTIQESMRLLLLVRAYQVGGHYAAHLDPLGLDARPPPPELDPTFYGFTAADLDREFFLGTWNQEGFLSESRPVRTLREILSRLRETYCGSVGYEYMHIPDRDKCNWLRARLETAEPPAYTAEKKLNILDRLTWSEMFESFLANKYTAAKRFGLEGCEALIPGMKALIDTSADLGVESIVIGMPHRGRLNVLANVMRKPMEQVFSEFAGRTPRRDPAAADAGDTYTGSGDVKYHLGTSYDRPTLSGRRIHLSLLANPSHLEAVDTVCLGKVRAKQYYAGDARRTAHMPVLMHGDGAFAGQGIVYECLDMSGLPDYEVGGTIHVVVNNQVSRHIGRRAAFEGGGAGLARVFLGFLGGVAGRFFFRAAHQSCWCAPPHQGRPGSPNCSAPSCTRPSPATHPPLPPGRLHHRPPQEPHLALLHRRRQGPQRARVPRQRRRRRGGGPRVRAGRRVAPDLALRRGHRHGGLQAARAQRDRRAHVHAARDVSGA